MILVGNQRGGAKNLALHLLKDENDHVEVHELRGFASDNLMGALNESYAISQGTRCKQFLFSLSLNPPPREQVRTEDFEAAIERAETELGLGGQPRAIVFHEKEGRRHAHAVWSRIDAEEMKAIQLSFTKRKLTDLSRDLYIEHQWKMPRGLAKSEERDPRNFSLEEWQQAKRAQKDAQEVKTIFQDCWAMSDNRASFMLALEERGYKLAKGDRRGFVAVNHKGEPFAVAKWAGIKTKDVRARLGEPDDLPGIEQRKQEFAEQITERLKQLQAEEERRAAEQRARQEAERKVLVDQQRAARAVQAEQQRQRQEREVAERQARFNKGLRGLFDRFTGQHRRTREQNERETRQSMQRDRAEKDALIFRQLDQRRDLRVRGNDIKARQAEREQELRADIRQYEREAKAVLPAQKPETTRRATRGPPQTSQPVRANKEAPSTKPDFTKASQPDNAQPDREARRAEFMRQRQAGQSPRERTRGPNFER